MQSVPITTKVRARWTTFCDKVCQWLVTSRWFSPGTSVLSTNKTDRHDITEILLKGALKHQKTNQSEFWVDYFLRRYCTFSVRIFQHKVCTVYMQLSQLNWNLLKTLHGSLLPYEDTFHHWPQIVSPDNTNYFCLRYKIHFCSWPWIMSPDNTCTKYFWWYLPTWCLYLQIIYAFFNWCMCHYRGCIYW